MSFLHAIILSIIEGITEFLPISSTGHLILASKVLGIPQTEFVKTFELVIQLGAIMSVVILYFKTLSKNTKTWGKILVGFIPTGVIGLTVYKYVKTYLLGNYNVVILSLFLGGIAIFVLEKLIKNKANSIDKIENLSYGKSLIIGLSQSVSMIPGVSRSLATIFGGLAVGFNRKTATEFSFLLAVPTMMAATGLDLIKSSYLFSSNEYLILLVGFIGAFLSSLMTIKFLISFVQKHTFKIFAVYRIALATIFWLIYR